MAGKRGATCDTALPQGLWIASDRGRLGAGAGWRSPARLRDGGRGLPDCHACPPARSWVAVDNPLSGRRVLVVEDEMIVSWLLQDLLADLGCEVVGPAARVDQALAIIDAEALDAVLLDLNLNGQMSYPVADALVARGVPFVFATGHAKDRLLDGYQAFPVLLKPFHRLEVGDVLAKLLAKKYQSPHAPRVSREGLCRDNAVRRTNESLAGVELMLRPDARQQQRRTGIRSSGTIVSCP
jgi:CheY-like chemotaxis protein